MSDRVGIELPPAVRVRLQMLRADVTVDWGERFGPHRQEGVHPIAWELSWFERTDTVPGWPDAGVQRFTRTGQQWVELDRALDTAIEFGMPGTAIEVCVSGWAAWARGATTFEAAPGFEFPTQAVSAMGY